MTHSSKPQKLAGVSVQSESDHEKKPQDNAPEYLSGAPLYLLLFGLLFAVFTMAIDIAIVATGRPLISLSTTLTNDE